MAIRTSYLAGVALALLLVGCKSSDTTGPGGNNNNNNGGNPPANSVTIASFAFSPDTLTVTAGSTVTFQNNDAVGHTATADDGTWDTGTIAGGSSATHTFATTGLFEFHCAIHASMKHAFIKVQ